MPSWKNLAEGQGDRNLPTREFRLKAGVIGITQHKSTKLLDDLTWFHLGKGSCITLISIQVSHNWKSTGFREDSYFHAQDPIPAHHNQWCRLHYKKFDTLRKKANNKMLLTVIISYGLSREMIWSLSKENSLLPCR